MAFYEKINVGMVPHYDEDGAMKPVEIEWVNGNRYPISKIIEKRDARSVMSAVELRCVIEF